MCEMLEGGPWQRKDEEREKKGFCTDLDDEGESGP
jgi:hypothetical protein